MEHIFGEPKQLFSTAVFGARNEFEIGSISYNWDILLDHRASIIRVGRLPFYLFKPEVLILLENEKNLDRRLIIDMMWSTGATVSEVLGLRRSSFSRTGSVYLKRSFNKPGRPTKKQQEMISPRNISINDNTLKDRIESFVTEHRLQPNDKLFSVRRQTVNRHIHELVEQSIGAPFNNITAETFRHSFAVHLILSGVPQSRIRKLLGLKKNHQVEKYEDVLPEIDDDFLKGVSFH